MLGLLKKLRLTRHIRAVQDARERYRDALRRGDSRDERAAHKVLVEATTARLRVETGRR